MLLVLGDLKVAKMMKVMKNGESDENDQLSTTATNNTTIGQEIQIFCGLLEEPLTVNPVVWWRTVAALFSCIPAQNLTWPCLQFPTTSSISRL